MILAILFPLLFMTALTLVAVDWRQTRWMTKHYESGLRETNPYLGKRPSTRKVDIYFLILLCIYSGILIFGTLMPNAEWVTWMSPLSAIFIHGKASYINYQNGIHLF